VNLAQEQVDSVLERVIRVQGTGVSGRELQSPSDSRQACAAPLLSAGWRRFIRRSGVSVRPDLSLRLGLRCSKLLQVGNAVS